LKRVEENKMRIEASYTKRNNALKKRRDRERKMLRGWFQRLRLKLGSTGLLIR